MLLTIATPEPDPTPTPEPTLTAEPTPTPTPDPLPTPAADPDVAQLIALSADQWDTLGAFLVIASFGIAVLIGLRL